MLLPWINNIAVHTVKEVLWYLHNCPPPSRRPDGGDLSSSRDATLPPPLPQAIPIQTRPALRFIALIIGIDKYAHSAIRDLCGAVADANEVKRFLIETVGVPSSHIKILCNDEATKDVIEEEIRKLGNDERIRDHEGDLILIFYAGHGAQVAPPPGWPSGTPDVKISMLVPHDFIPVSSSSEGHGVLDITLSRILGEIAQKKGDNITVILDSCYSGSGAREDENDPTFSLRGIELPEDYAIIVPELRAADVASGYDKTGLSSYVLLSACMENQRAREKHGQGVFTKALLETLRIVGVDKISYEDLIARLPDLGYGQNPQCEGDHQSRILFQSKVPNPRRVLYRVLPETGEPTPHYVLEAGEAHGITVGTEFAVYMDEKVDASQALGTLVAYEPTAFTTKMRRADGSPSFELSKPGFVLQTRVGKEEDLRLFIELDTRLIDVFLRVKDEMQRVGAGKRGIILVERDEQPNLVVAVEDDDVVFNIMDENCRYYGLTRMPFKVPLDAEIIYPILCRAADFYWHLRRSSKKSIIASKVEFECTKLTESDNFDDDLVPVLIPEGDNLNRGGVITVFADDKTAYGFKISNKSNVPLFGSLFYFDVSDLSITLWNPLRTARKGIVDAPLPAGGVLTMGYGSGGARPQQYMLRKEQDVDVGFLKLFLSTEYVDYSNMIQASPFMEERFTVEHEPSRRSVWEALLITVVQRKRGA